MTLMSLMTRKQAAGMLGTSWQGVRRMARSGLLRHTDDEHGHRRYRRADVVATRIRRRYAEPQIIWAAGRMILGRHTAVAVEYIGHRPGGDVDAVVSVTPYRQAPMYLALRRSQDGWRWLVDFDGDVASAVHRAEHGQRFAVSATPEPVAAALDTLEAAA